jgi:argininosuccinate lyase
MSLARIQLFSDRPTGGDPIWNRAWFSGFPNRIACAKRRGETSEKERRMAMSDLRLWGARFRSGPHPDLMQLSRAEASYYRLVPYDLIASEAHARELQRANILTAAECETLIDALQKIRASFQSGELKPSGQDEDVHTFLERVLVERLGPLGGKLRAGRSRNDQAANDLKLYLRDQAREILAALLDLQDALLSQAARHVETLAPGFTHLQPAQPIVFAHQLLAHAQNFLRDGERFIDWDKRSATSPLGSAALAGSAIALHPETSAQELGYEAPCENSIDAVGSRDHVAECLFVCALLGVNLSRLCEEIILWASRQFRWVELDDAYATGSSIMPQKKNPDIAELVRGRAGRLIGGLTGLLTMLKALPYSYNRDLSEDKHYAFEAVDTLRVLLPPLTGMVRTMRVNVEELRRQAAEGFTLATEVADGLTLQGVPFAAAHEITGALVKYCEDHGVGLGEVPDEALQVIDPHLGPAITSRLTLAAAVAARKGMGGTAPSQVSLQLERLRAKLSLQRCWAIGKVEPRQ